MKIKTLRKAGISLFLLAFIMFPGLLLATDVPIPQNLAGSPRDSAVFLQWTNPLETIDHIIEYKESSDENWNIFEHPASNVNGITVTDLENGTSYDFRISVLSTFGQSEPTLEISVTPEEGSIHVSNNYIISTGQSLALGYASFPVLSFMQSPLNLMISEGDMSQLWPLREPISGGMIGGTGETMSSGFVNTVSSTLQNQFPGYSFIININAVGGVTYQDLKKDSPAYEFGLLKLRESKKLSLVSGKPVMVPAVTVIHGETDELTGTTASEYEAYLVEWQRDYENDVKKITGQSEDTPLFTDQMSSWVSMGHSVPSVAIGQYNAAKNNPEKIIMVTPKYIFDSADSVSHMTNYSSRRLGEYYAKVYKKVIIEKETWTPLMPQKITMRGNIIKAKFHVPVPPLSFDTTAVGFKDNYGFEYSDSTNSASIVDVQIISPDTVQVTLSNIPTGTNPRLRYAYTGIPWSWTGRDTPGSARGNLRDSDMTPSLYTNGVPESMGNYLYNWALTFDEPVTKIKEDKVQDIKIPVRIVDEIKEIKKEPIIKTDPIKKIDVNLFIKDFKLSEKEQSILKKQ